jgi:hypothetical protein
MAEGLSLEDAQQAEDNFYNSKYFTEQYEQLKEERATAAKHKDAIIDLLRDKENLMLSDTVVAELEEVRALWVLVTPTLSQEKRMLRAIAYGKATSTKKPTSMNTSKPPAKKPLPMV